MVLSTIAVGIVLAGNNQVRKEVTAQVKVNREPRSKGRWSSSRKKKTRRRKARLSTPEFGEQPRSPTEIKIEQQYAEIIARA
jgi:hypothetical protein